MGKIKERVKEIPCAVPETAVELLEEIADRASRRRGEVSRMFFLHGLAAYMAGTALEDLDDPFRQRDRKLTMADLMEETPDAIAAGPHIYKNSASARD